MFTGSSRRGDVGDVMTAALFSGRKLRDGDSLSAFARRMSRNIETNRALGDLAVLQTRSEGEHARVESERFHAT
jgi:hypothetical protein